MKEKLVITAYDKPGNGKNRQGDYEFMINPAAINISKSINRNIDKAPHGKKSNPSFGSYNSDTLNFEAIIDGTGATGKLVIVQEEIEKMESVIYDYQGDIHDAYFLIIKWGELGFKGYLSSLQINYTLFDSEGKAIRAKVNLSFIEYIPQKEFAKNDNSPDMSHIKFVTESDTLANYCDDIYGDPKYLIQTARFNGLINFRKLQPGNRLEFPPLINIDYV